MGVGWRCHGGCLASLGGLFGDGGYAKGGFRVGIRVGFGLGRCGGRGGGGSQE